MNLALALYTVYDELQNDLEHTLRTVREIGYQAVEFYGETKWPAVKLKELLARNDLELCGWHVEWKLLQPELIRETIRYHQELGNPNIVIPCLGGPWNIGHTAEENSAAVWEKHAGDMNRIAGLLEGEGMRLGYHTHAHEFEDRFEDVTPWDILLESTKPSIFLELDTGNCLEGGADPVLAIKQAAGRLETVHCKPFSSISGTEAGISAVGDLNDWPSIVRVCRAGGCRYLAIENEAVSRGNKFTVARQDLQSLELHLFDTP
ncbi:sugar phosphate isomerase/epimerase family protein [Paenibacillus physcomitrellae]|uniref:Sugar phosphate isomerase n=1 Tax=Paenibacillus physcomitrellae TaxID=1619311 RepID=A0ABQ1G4A7_9BACL|nr:sugar phosphate isomerase/epimerase [Paenibacillus physcomitrellae]GGA37131.1 sugar phosphate isomerase [Paenibacillus physcomitrellae]